MHTLTLLRGGECPFPLLLDEDNGSQGSEGSSCSDYGSHDRPGTSLRRAVSEAKTLLPDTFQTNNLLFYERFKTYQDYMLGE